ncbi:hypothetical protein EG68_05962 [Paragonimus skrjabini miyazakii]|uniref:Ubiquitin carboxyl-terminal hydrolase n=1 Tax=Paragonimus skrjabini miyazakii TaxID=59628 RepID=A0A8S9Y852_9TREM|nr:hypothetical protein EG68_05962 [Paragonimus skrjabini miyazakii]
MQNNGMQDVKTVNTGSCSTLNSVTQSVSYGQNSVFSVTSNSHKQRASNASTSRLEELFTSKRTVTNVSDSRRPSHSRRPSADEVSVGPRLGICDRFQQSSSFSRSDSPIKWKTPPLSGSRDCSGRSSGSKFPLCNTNTTVVPSDLDGERSLTHGGPSSKGSLQETCVFGNLVNTFEGSIITASKTDLLSIRNVSSLSTELVPNQRPQPSILGNCSQLPSLTSSSKEIHPTQEGSEVLTCERRAEQHTDTQSGVTVIRMNNPDVKSRQDLPSDFDRPHLQPYVGLYNHGNTCYMSAIFQCLRFTPALFKACTGHSEKAAPSEKLLQSLAVLFRSMADKASHRKLYDDVERVRTEIGRSDSCYKSSEQQDALEFLVCLLDSLHSEIQHSSGGKLDCCNVSITTNVGLSPQPLDLKPSEAAPFLNERPTPGVSSLGKKSGRGFSGWLRSRKKQTGKKITGQVANAYTSMLMDISLRECQKSALTDALVEPVDYIHPAIRAWENEVSRESSYVKDTFMGQLQTYRKCLKCWSETLSYGIVWNLSVPIPDSSTFADPKHQTVVNSSVRYGGSMVAPNAVKQSHPPVRDRPKLLYDGLSQYSGSQSWPSRNAVKLFDSSNVSTCRQPWDPEQTVNPIYRPTTNQPYSPSNLLPTQRSTVKTSVRRVTLSQCLQACMATEVLDDSDRPWCDHCKEKTVCLIQNTISRLPDVLVIRILFLFMTPCFSRLSPNILRFHSGERRQKNCVHVDFDMTLDMSKYTTSEYEKRHPLPLDDHSLIYRLYAVVYHDGALSFGHYTAACHVTNSDGDRPDEPQWFEFDDECVKETNLDLVNRPSAYILFYERESPPSKPIKTDSDQSAKNDNGVQATLL